MSSDHDDDGDRLSGLFERLRGEGGAAVPTSAFGRLRRMAGTALRTARAARKGGGPGEGLGAVDLDAIERLVMSLGELKGVAMKMGQILSYIDADMPPETQRLMGLLQVYSQPTPFETIAATIREDVPAEADVILASLDREPVASASIGQVHRARRPDGTAVAVKVRHPGIDDAIRADFRSASIGKVMERGPHVISAGASVAFGQAYKTKRAIFRLRIPGKLLFLFRIRFGLYAVLARLGAEVDWRAFESELTDGVLSAQVP